MPGAWQNLMQLRLFMLSLVTITLIPTVFPRIIAGATTIFFPQKGVDYLRGRLFQILLTGGRAQNILFYYSIKPKIDNIN